MNEITTILNSPSPTEPNALDRLSALDVQLRNWYASLPADVALDESNVSNLNAAAFGLHMQFCRVQMLLHRVPSSNIRKRRYGEIDVQPATLRGWTIERSQYIIHQNAVKIVRLGLTYKRIYGVENTPSVMLDNLYAAATTLISVVLKQSDGVINSSADLEWLYLLDEITLALLVHFPIVTRMRQTLNRLVENTQVTKLFSSQSGGPPVETPNATLAQSSGGHWGSWEAVLNDCFIDTDFVNFDYLNDGHDGIER